MKLTGSLREVVDKPHHGFREPPPPPIKIPFSDLVFPVSDVLSYRTVSLDNKREDFLSAQTQKYKIFDRNVENRSSFLSENYSKLNISLHNFNTLLGNDHCY